MNEKNFKDYYINNFLNKKRSFIGTNFIQEKKIIKKSENENSNPSIKELILKIKTDSDSPIQNDFWNGKWKERIDSRAFDESINNIAETPINSYIDHDMSIKGLIASTSNDSLKVVKENDGVYGFIKQDLNNPDLEKVFKWIENNTVKSNSFIFQPIDIEFSKEVLDGETIELVIHKKAKLLSIDPVIAGFYPQNDCEVKSSENRAEGKKNMNIKKEYKQIINLSKKRKLTDLENQRKIELENLILKSLLDEKEEDNDKIEKNLGSEVKDDAENNDSEIDEKNLGSEVKDDAENNDSEIDAKDDIEIDEIDDQDFNDDEDKPDGKKDKPDELKSENPPDLKLTKSQIINKKFRNGNIQKINLGEKEIKNIMNYNQTEKRFSSSTSETKRNLIAESHTKHIDNFLASLSAEKRAEVVREVNLISNGLVFEKRADGSNYLNGMAYISIINDPEVMTQLEKVLPEINGARIINLDNLDEVKKDLLLPRPITISELKEGEDSQLYNSDTISITFLPRRYSIELRNNSKIANASELLEKESSNGKSGIISKIRQAFYESLVKHKDVELSTLVSATASSYDGGITKDSIVQASELNKITFTDFDKIIDSIVSDYGISVQDNFHIYMHPTTWTALIAEYNKSPTPSWGLIDRTKKTYRDVQIITANEYKYTNNQANVPVAIFARKDATVIRGLSFVMEDNLYNLMSKALLQRFISTRGEMKMIDPYLNTYSLQYATTRAEKNIIDKSKAALGLDDLSKAQDKLSKINNLISSMKEKNSTKEKEIRKLEELQSQQMILDEEVKKLNEN